MTPAFREIPRARIISVLAALILVGAGVAQLVILHRDSRAREAGTEGRAAAVRLVPILLSYGSTSLDTDMARAEETTTGSFSDQFAIFARDFIDTQARKKDVTTKASVHESAIVSSSPEQAVIIMIIDQVTTSKDLAAPRLDSSCIRVTLTDETGEWLISEMSRL